jgi:hypothetical protein
VGRAYRINAQENTMIWNSSKKTSDSILIDKRTKDHINKAADGLNVLISQMDLEQKTTGYDLSTYAHALDGIRIALRLTAGDNSEALLKEAFDWNEKNNKIIAEIESTSN